MDYGVSVTMTCLRLPAMHPPDRSAVEKGTANKLPQVQIQEGHYLVACHATPA
jgi:hypothetical protein